MSDTACIKVPMPPAPTTDADDAGTRICAPGDVVAVVWPANGIRRMQRKMRVGESYDVGLYRITREPNGWYRAEGPCGSMTSDPKLSDVAAWVAADARRWGAA